MSTRVQRVRHIAAWACATCLQNAVDAERTVRIGPEQTHTVSEYVYNHPIFGERLRQQKKWTIRLPSVMRACNKMDIYGVFVPNNNKKNTFEGTMFYLVGRMGITGEWFFKDYKAHTDFRVLAICEAYDWFLHNWREKPKEEYNYSTASLRNRIIELRTLPVVGDIPDPSGISPVSTLQGVSAVRIIVGQKAIRFPLYATIAADSQRWIDIGLAVEQEILTRLEKV